MFTRTTCSLALVAVVALPARAVGQVSQPADVRVLALRGLQAGRTVRVAGRDIGTVTGSFMEVRDGTLQLQDQSVSRMVPVAGIDSMWAKTGGHAATGALVGSLAGAVVGFAANSGRSCAQSDVSCFEAAWEKWSGIALGGMLVGALIGSGAKRWQLRYP
jgi:hypothetical protein